MKFLPFYVFFFCINLVNFVVVENTANINLNLRVSMVSALQFTDLTDLLPPWNQPFDTLMKRTREELEKCFNEIDNNISSSDSLNRHILCGGILASIMLEGQTCISKPRNKKPPCVSRYRIISVSVPKLAILKKEYLEVIEHPVHPCRWHKPMDSYVGYRDGAIIIGTPPFSEKSFWSEKPCGEDLR